MKPLLELCAEGTALVEVAIRAGASRIELCANLAEGGTTPSADDIASASAIAHSLGATVMVMARPRGGDFAYSEAELAAMEAAVDTARERGADGVVFGCVRDGWLDEPACKRMIARAAGMDTTFHMAFDELPCLSARRAALDWLADRGVGRILTHGGPLETSLSSHYDELRQLITYAGDRIGMMPGGGVTYRNAAEVAAATGADQLHGTRIVPFDR